MRALVKLGPVTLSVAANIWTSYGGGVFEHGLIRKCGYNVDHLVVLVGYGTTADGVDYWLIRNSWGPRWGEKGYIRIRRHTGEEPCGVDTQPLDGVCGLGGPCKCQDPIHYCGVCGLLSESVVPVGAHWRD